MLIPDSSYRIQLNDHFTLKDLRDILDYLHDLGISTIYAAPMTTAIKGSSHGYDVADPLTLNAEIGTEQELQELASALKARGMSWLQDIVPNHMAYTAGNHWLYDVLERGRASRYYDFFDIIGDHPVELLGDRLMAPFLGATLTECLQRGELTLQFTPTGFTIRYFDNDYPVAPNLYRWICTVSDGYPENLLTILDSLEQSLLDEPDTWKRTKESCLRTLTADPAFATFIATRITFFNERINLIESLLQNQHYVLTHHHLASTHINYRRFFTVNSLICLRMERPEVFDSWHSTIHRWYKEGWIQGLRIDHIDGLAAPKKYLTWLRQLFGEDCYIVAEKILTAGEKMPAGWPIEGSTGYDFLADASQLLTDADGSRELLAFYREQVLHLPPYDTVVYERKLDFLRRQMGGELDNLMELLTGLPLLHADSQDKGRLKRALATWLACFPVYRAYPDDSDNAGDANADAQFFATALARSRQREPDLLQELNYLGELTTGSGTLASGAGPMTSGSGTVITGSGPMSTGSGTLATASAPLTGQRLAFVNRLMQFTGPLAAKGVEDTTFYVYNPYIAHCEVGDTTSIAGIGPEDFHRRMQDRRAHQRHSLNATTTHDTKRGEDGRIRLSMLSAQPQEWIAAVRRWRSLNRTQVTTIKGRPAPSPNDEYLIYQALLGSIPEDGIITNAYRERFAGYLTKALREAKTETNYDNPDEAYEQQCQSFAAMLLAEDSPFMEDFLPFAYSIVRGSAPYSLAQLLLKLTAPGIPDIYQGAELWETSLVDPDNRRPVDFHTRKNLLQQLKAAEAVGSDSLRQFLRDHRQHGVEKMFTLYRVLHYRRRFPQLFSEGEYIPVKTHGPLLAYIRRYGHHWALVGVPLIRYETDISAPVSLELPPDMVATLAGQTASLADMAASSPVQNLSLPKQTTSLPGQTTSLTNIFTGETVDASSGTLTWPEGLADWPLIFFIFAPQA